MVVAINDERAFICTQVKVEESIKASFFQLKREVGTYINLRGFFFCQF